MTPENPIVGGTVLRIPAVQSPNFSISGKTGWAIFADGTAYFFDVNVAGTITGSTIQGATIEGSEFLIYSATLTPVANELLMSLVRGTVTDSAGNETVDGFAYYYLGSDGNFYVISLTNGTIQLSGTGAPNETGPWNQISNLFFDRTGVIRIVTPDGQIAGLNATLEVTAGPGTGGAGGTVSVLGAMTASNGVSVTGGTTTDTLDVTSTSTFGGKETISAGGLAVTGGTTTDTLDVTTTATISGALTATGGTAASPTLVTTDTWHTITLDTGWTAGSPAPQYRLLPDGNMQLAGKATHAAITTETAVNSTHALGTAYRPASDKKVYQGSRAGGLTGAALDTTGIVYAEPNGISSTTVDLTGIIDLL